MLHLKRAENLITQRGNKAHALRHMKRALQKQAFGADSETIDELHAKINELLQQHFREVHESKDAPIFDPFCVLMAIPEFLHKHNIKYTNSAVGCNNELPTINVDSRGPGLLYYHESDQSCAQAAADYAKALLKSFCTPPEGGKLRRVEHVVVFNDIYDFDNVYFMYLLAYCFDFNKLDVYSVGRPVMSHDHEDLCKELEQNWGSAKDPQQPLLPFPPNVDVVPDHIMNSDKLRDSTKQWFQETRPDVVTMGTPGWIDAKRSTDEAREATYTYEHIIERLKTRGLLRRDVVTTVQNMGYPKRHGMNPCTHTKIHDMASGPVLNEEPFQMPVELALEMPVKNVKREMRPYGLRSPMRSETVIFVCGPLSEIAQTNLDDIITDACSDPRSAPEISIYLQAFSNVEINVLQKGREAGMSDEDLKRRLSNILSAQFNQFSSDVPCALVSLINKHSNNKFVKFHIATTQLTKAPIFAGVMNKVLREGMNAKMHSKSIDPIVLKKYLDWNRKNPKLNFRQLDETALWHRIEALEKAPPAQME